MAASPREKIKLESTGKKKDGKPTKTFYTTYKNKRKSTEKLNLKKYDPRAYNPETQRAGLHVIFKEGKIKK